MKNKLLLALLMGLAIAVKGQDSNTRKVYLSEAGLVVLCGYLEHYFPPYHYKRRFSFDEDSVYRIWTRNSMYSYSPFNFSKYKSMVDTIRLLLPVNDPFRHYEISNEDLMDREFKIITKVIDCFTGYSRVYIVKKKKRLFKRKKS